jgi:NitT/TauT family transport system ATP-binding protein
MRHGGIELEGVSKTFGTSGDAVVALRGVSLRSGPQAFTALVGPSGCGKTTVLKLIGGLEQPTSGAIKVDGMSPDEARRERYFSYGFQNPVLLPWLTVVQNVELLPALARQPARVAPVDLLSAVGLAGFENRYPHELSGGMRQRASLARALTLNPKYLLLDEPFGALDDLTRENLDDTLARTWARGDFGCVLITHNVNEAVYLADEIVVFTPRPANVATVVRNPLPRPRFPGMRMSAEFMEVVGSVREALA